MWGWIAAAFVGLFFVTALRPKIESEKPAEFSDFDAPTAEEGREIPVVFGTVKIKGPNVVWYGDLEVKAIRKGGGGKK